MRGLCLLLLLSAGLAAGGRSAPPEPTVPALEARLGEARLRLVELSRDTGTTLAAPGAIRPGPTGREVHSSLRLSFEILGGQEWLERVRSGQFFLAEDDRGNLVRLESGLYRKTLATGGADADRLTRPYLNLTTSSLDPQARALRWIEGRLVMQGAARPFRHDFRLQADGLPAPLTLHGVEVSLLSARVEAGTLTVQWRARRLNRAASGLLVANNAKTLLRKADGTELHYTHVGHGTSGETNVSAGIDHVTVTDRYSGVDAVPPVITAQGMLNLAALAAEPVRFGFLPLPGAQKGTANASSPAHPLFGREARSSLKLQVTADGRPPGRGILSLQFHPWEWPGRSISGALPWVDLRPDSKGRVHLEHVWPGRYTLRVQWRPAVPRGLAAPILEAQRQQLRVPDDGEVVLPPIDVSRLAEAPPTGEPPPPVPARQPRRGKPEGAHGGTGNGNP